MKTKMTKYAAIDIGSNAVRLLLSAVSETGGAVNVKKISWVRMPIRLGEDAFLDGRISREKADKLIKSLTGFRYLIEAYGPEELMACATAAMRTAENGSDLCREIHEKTGISIDIIDGAQEARFLFQNRHRIMDAREKAALFIDVGGGSTEMTLFHRGKIKESRSFNIGTVRLLNHQVDPAGWEDMKSWTKTISKGFPAVEAIGSGGNINKLFKLTKEKSGKPVSAKKLRDVYARLSYLSVEERIEEYRLRPDRADVIVPGAEIYLKVMDWAGCKKIHVPMQGLADGMVRVLHGRRKT